jgi:hypothetical protein
VSEHEFQPRSTPTSLLSVIDDLEQGIEALTASLDSLRATVRVVSEQVRALDRQEVPGVPVLTVVESTPEPNVAAEPDREPSGAAPGSDADRDEVRRAVEAMRAELEKPAPASTGGVQDETNRRAETSRAELSWSNLRVDSGFSVAPSEPMAAASPPEEDASKSAADAEEARREEVRLAVERARLAMDEANAAAPAVDPEEARREEVRLAVERARAEMFGEKQAPPVDDDEAKREEVRRMVESTRGSLSWSTMKSDGGSWGQFQPEPGGFSIGRDQAPPKPVGESNEPSDPDQARREEVRRAVEAARAEMAPEDAGPKIVPIVPRPGSPSPKGADFNGPPVIVIEDPSGRVELSQVFATLSKVDRSAQAALLNYSPHSVTIGLGMTSAVPDPNELALAAQSVFGRSCTVKLDGNRTAIEVGIHPVG